MTLGVRLDAAGADLGPALAEPILAAGGFELLAPVAAATAIGAMLLALSVLPGSIRRVVVRPTALAAKAE